MTANLPSPPPPRTPVDADGTAASGDDLVAPVEPVVEETAEPVRRSGLRKTERNVGG